MGWTLAVDFGTTYTAAACSSGGATQLLTIGTDTRVPSGVLLLPVDDAVNGDRLVAGRAAEHQAALYPGNFEPTPKRVVGQDTVLLGDDEVRPSELVAAVLRLVAAEASRQQGADPDEVRLTHPVRWRAERLAVLREAAELAKLREPVLVTEPEAAASYYALSTPLPVGAHLAVYDLGGGTFDAAVITRTENGFEVAGGAGGLDPLGGVDFDWRLFEHIGRERLAVDHPELWANLLQPPDHGWASRQRRLLEAVRVCKEMLSDRPAWSIAVPGTDISVRVTQEEFRELVRPLIDETVTELANTIKRAGMVPSELTDVYLIGGSSRMPLVDELIRERLDLRPRVLEDPKAVVARGAATATIQSSERIVPVPDTPDPVVGHGHPSDEAGEVDDDAGASSGGLEADGWRWLGRRVRARLPLRSFSGVVIADDPSGAKVLAAGKVRPCPWPRLSVEPQGPHAESTSAAYRLWAEATLLFGDDAATARSAALDAARRSGPITRAFAAAAATAGDVAAIDGVMLAEPERTWLMAHAAYARGDWSAVIDGISRLPPDRYPEKLELVLASWGVIHTDPDRRRVVVEQASSFAGTPLADLVLAACSDAIDPNLVVERAGRIAPLSAAAEPLAQVATGERTDLAAVAAVAARGGSNAAGELLLSGESLEGDQADAGVIALAEVNSRLLDEALEANPAAVGAAVGRALARFPDADRAYWRARVDAGGLSDDEVMATGHRFEAARRRLLAGEPVGDGGEIDAPMTVLASLSELAAGDPAAATTLRPLLDEAQAELAGQLVAALAGGPITAELVADASLWTTLATTTADPAPGPGSARFAAWRALRQGLVAAWDGRFTDAARLGVTAAALARPGQVDAVATEALNLRAWALASLGDRQAAVSVLVDAGATAPAAPAALVINFEALRAPVDPLGSSAGLAALALRPAQAMQPAVAEALTLAALDLWETAGGTGEVTDPLRAALRALTSAATSLDTHVRVLRAMTTLDSAWIADPSNTQASPHATTSEHRYLVATAHDQTRGLGVMAEALRSESSLWMQEERDRVVRETMERLSGADVDASAAATAFDIVDHGVQVTAKERVQLQLGGVRQLLAGLDSGRWLRPDIFLRLAAVATQAASDPTVAGDDSTRVAIADLSGRVIDHNVVAISRAAAGVWERRAQAQPGALVDDLLGLRSEASALWAIAPDDAHREEVRRHISRIDQCVSDLGGGAP